MEVLIRTHRARRPGGGEALIHEYWEMIDHSPLQTGADWLPAGKRYALSTGEELRRVDEVTFQLVGSGHVLTVIP